MGRDDLRERKTNPSVKGTGATHPEPYQKTVWEAEAEKRKTTRNLPQWITHGPLVQVLRDYR